MESFAGKVAVVTGGGSGIGRALVRQLAREGASVAVIDLNAGPAAETVALAMADAPTGVRVTAHTGNVADEVSLAAARDEILARHSTAHLDLLFNNAGIAGAGSFVTSDREAWERVFDICWRGVYLGCRTFLPQLVASDEACIVNTASINAVWPKHGAGNPSTAYGAAKYAVKGFSEALIEDLRTHAPHVRVAVVMPGSVATNIGENSSKVIGPGHWPGPAAGLRDRLLDFGAPVENASEEQLRKVDESSMGALSDLGYLITVEEAAATILRGIHERRWRIITGIDAERLDRLVRADPERAFDEDGPSLAPPWLSLLVTLRALLDGSRAPAGSFGFRFGDDRPVGVRIDEDEVTFVASPDPSPIATLELEPDVLRQLLVHERGVSDAVESGALRIDGDRAAVEMLFAAVAEMTATQ